MQKIANEYEGPEAYTSFFSHVHSKRFYPYGLYSDLVHNPDPYGTELFTSIDERDLELSPVQGLLIRAFILVFLGILAWIIVTI